MDWLEPRESFESVIYFGLPLFGFAALVRCVVIWRSLDPLVVVEVRLVIVSALETEILQFREIG
jgi:hypothetical protein